MPLGAGEGPSDRTNARQARRLLVYTHALAGGGAERVCATLASGFAKQGWDVLFVVDQEEDANRAFLTSQVRVVVLGRNHTLAVLRLSRLLARERPDVSLSAIGVSNLKHAIAATLAGRQASAILSYHAFAASEPQLLSRSAFWLLPLLSRLTARTIAVSQGLRGHLIEQWRASPKRTTTIYNPVLVGRETTPLPRERGSHPLILAAGRLVEGKNMLGVIRAFSRIAPQCDARLVILGEGPERPALEAEVAARGLQDRVCLPGYAAEPWDLYRRAACFVSASPLESFSMVIVEALSYGLPVVAFDSPGPREVLADGRFGTLVPPGDEAALGDGMLQALASPSDVAGLRTRGRVFSLDAGLDAYRRVFTDVIARREGGSALASFWKDKRAGSSFRIF